MKTKLFLLLLALSVLRTQAQSLSIKGRVTDTSQEAYGIFLQLYIAQVEAFIQFQQYVFTLEADEGDGKAVIACLDFMEGELPCASEVTPVTKVESMVHNDTLAAIIASVK